MKNLVNSVVFASLLSGVVYAGTEFKIKNLDLTESDPISIAMQLSILQNYAPLHIQFFVDVSKEVSKKMSIKEADEAFSKDSENNTYSYITLKNIEARQNAKDCIDEHPIYEGILSLTRVNHDLVEKWRNIQGASSVKMYVTWRVPVDN